MFGLTSAWSGLQHTWNPSWRYLLKYSLLERSSQFINFPMTVPIEGKYTSASTLENSPKQARQCHILLHSAEPGTTGVWPCHAKQQVLFFTIQRQRWGLPGGLHTVFAVIEITKILCKDQSLEFGCAIILGQALAAVTGCPRAHSLLEGAGKTCLPKPGTSANIPLLEKMNFILVYLSKYNRKNKGERVVETS